MLSDIHLLLVVVANKVLWKLTLVALPCSLEEGEVMRFCVIPSTHSILGGAL